LVDAQDLKFCGRKAVWVRFPPWTPVTNGSFVMGVGIEEVVGIDTIQPEQIL
jgi:hypothetical protein